MPGSPVDETKVPHYFGPYPNWANSPFTLPNVTVNILGDGAGATADATVGANGAITSLTLTNAGYGYTFATVEITSTTGTGALGSALVTNTGSVTSLTVDNPGAGYTNPSVTLSGGGGLGNLRYYGNQLIDRTYATEDVGNVFVVLPEALPNGYVQSFMIRNQPLTGASIAASSRHSFNVYVLRPTGKANEYAVVHDSGPLVMPQLKTPGVSEVVTFLAGNITVRAGDVLGFYGQGIPLDVGTGTDMAMYALSAPSHGEVITLGSLEYMSTAQPRTYSFAANVVDTTGIAIPDNAEAVDGGAQPEVVATATAYGGVDAVILVTAGISYTYPTVDFDMPTAPGGIQAQAHALFNPVTGVISDVIVDYPGTGYAFAPNVVIRDGTLFDPILPGGSGATATATIAISEILVDNPGSGYVAPPTVVISDVVGSGTGAAATASISAGGVIAISLDAPGSGYVTAGGMRKFVDTLPGLGPTQANNLGQYIPVAVPDQTTFPGTDYYEIAVVEYFEQMHSDLPPTQLRGYVQLETSVITGTHYVLPGGRFGVDSPHYLGPTIIASKDRAVRITFYNLLPTGADGDLFMPVDSTIMGSGMGPMDMMEPMDMGTVTDEIRNPMCTEDPKPMGCFKDNRATLHLHGGNTPWISDGTPHQWITPAGEDTPWPEGVSVYSVPDMVNVPGVPDCSAPDDGCMTFYYTNQQSARLMFYHDHSWGITRLNVYAGEAAAYLITDAKEAGLVNNGLIPAEQIPLVIQDRTYVPQADQLSWQDPTWDTARWGGYGNLWYHHVYMTAQNPGAPGGMSGFGRWMYSPWFWPPQNAEYDPIPNPYYNMDPKGPDGAVGTMDDWTSPLAVPCNLDDPSTWQFQEEPWCEPQLIPSTPLISAGMEQFNDTPVVNGTAYPTITLEPKAYRFRILNAANDRFWNLQWYIGDDTTASTGLNSLGQVIGATEVALNAAEVAAAQLDPTIFPTPDLLLSPAGPDWVVIGSEGGFLPAPVVVDGQQVTTWINDPTRFDAGLVDLHSLVLAPAERADVIVDFSQFAGQTIILYNDAPAAYPARVPSYDYYTGAPDLMPVGAPQILPGYGPNTRTIMQVKIAGTPAPAFNLNALNTAFLHKADGSGAFESSQPPIIVGQSAYNSAYGKNFAASGWCNAPTNPSARCDGFVRISEQGGDMYKFDTLRMKFDGTYPPGYGQVSVKIEPKAIQDETSESLFDEFGRMMGVLGVEVVPATPGLANTVLYPYMSSITEIIDTTNLPSTGDLIITPIARGDDGTQIWKITHNGVDTHPIHVHAYDAQILNRVTWDNIIKPPEATELGWKETFRVSPLEDTIIVLRPIIPTLPFDLPNSIRLLSPMMMEGNVLWDSTFAWLNGLPMMAFAPNGEPIDVVNHYVNYGAEYVYHCHILSHEEMDMMRPVIFAYPPIAPSGLSSILVSGQGNKVYADLTWTDNSLSETEFVVERMPTGGGWVPVGTVNRVLFDPLTGELLPNTTGDLVTFRDDTYNPEEEPYLYRVVAQNTVGDTWDYSNPRINNIQPGAYAFPVISLKAYSNETGVLPSAPSELSASLRPGPEVGLSWMDNAINETGFVVERSENGVDFTAIATLGDRNNTGRVTYVDTTVVVGFTYYYRVAAFNATGLSAYSNGASIAVTAPLAPSNLVVSAVRVGNNERVTLTWTDNANNESGYEIQYALDSAFTNPELITVGFETTTYTTGNLTRQPYYFRIRAINFAGGSEWANATPFPLDPPAIVVPIFIYE